MDGLSPQVCSWWHPGLGALGFSSVSSPVSCPGEMLSDVALQFCQLPFRIKPSGVGLRGETIRK